MVIGLRLIIGMLTILLWRCRIIPKMVAGSVFSSVGGFEVAGAGVYLLAAKVAFECAVWGVAEEYGDARLERRRVFVPVPGLCRLSSVPSSGVPLLLCRRTGLAICVLITSMLPGPQVGCWIVTAWLSLCLWSRMGIWSLLLST